jgi:hypothetical protein
MSDHAEQLEREIEEHNQLVKQIEDAKEELLLRRGRCQVLSELIKKEQDGDTTREDDSLQDVREDSASGSVAAGNGGSSGPAPSED